MEFSVKSGSPEKQRSACIVVGVYEPRRLSAVAEQLDKISEGYISNLLRRGDLEGKPGQMLLLHHVPNVLSERVLLVGCGKERELDERQYRQIIAKTISTLNETGSMEAVCFLSELHELSPAPAHFAFACQLCADLYRAKQRVFVYTSNQQQAELIDELLWQFDPDSFVPHNLTGEGPARGTPIEIGWQAPRQSRQVLINLTDKMPDFARRFASVIEFVPAEPALKTQARERYKQYRQAGITPETVTIG
ncbi:DNA polymerase III subunit chi [Alishewanella longhuensis]